MESCAPRYTEADHRQCCECLAEHKELSGFGPACVTSADVCTEALTKEGRIDDLDLNCVFETCSESCGYLERGDSTR